jgi:hypothetical protein
VAESRSSAGLIAGGVRSRNRTFAHSTPASGRKLGYRETIRRAERQHQKIAAVDVPFYLPGMGPI